MTIPQYELKDFWVEPEKLLLWPNNPRLKISSFDDLKYSPDELCSQDVQDKLWDLMRKEEHNVSEIIDSIESQGYTNLNSIIIKRVGNTEKFIVLEGNRRTTAIRHWLKNSDELSDEISKTLNLIPAKEFVHDGEDDYIQIFQLLAQMHIAGPKPWTPVQQAHMISQTYDGLCKREGITGEFQYCPRITKECAKTLGQRWNEVKKDLAIYRIYKQLQSSGFLVEHEHYTKIRMLFDSSHLFKDYMYLDPETFHLSSNGLDRFNDLFIEKDCAVGNPQDFRKLKFLYQKNGAKELDMLRLTPKELNRLYDRAKEESKEDEALHLMRVGLGALKKIKLSELGCNETEEKELVQIQRIAKNLLDVVHGIEPSVDEGISGTDGSSGLEQQGIDLEVEESLGRDDLVDPRYDETFYYKDYDLDTSSMEGNESIQIDLISDDFDAFLYIFDGDAEEHFLTDDNGGDGQNARIRIINDLHKKYRIRVTSAEPEEIGKFTLMIG